MTGALERVVDDLVEAAQAASPKAVKTILGGGLVINLKIEGAGFVLTIWRLGVHPSIQEWNIVSQSFAWPVPISTPVRGRHENKYYLRGRIPGRP